MTKKQENAPIIIDNVSASYGKNSVLNGVSFEVGSKETVGMVGLNGVGKTTLIKILLGLKEPDTGSVKIFGNKPDNMEGKKNLAFLPEKFEPPPFLTGHEFLKFSQSLYERSYSMDEAYAIADRLHLDKAALARRVTTYSKGMRQKLGLMATLLTDCPLLILDEPMTGLDPRARVLVKDEIAHYHSRGKTVLMCSHILADLDELCDKMAVIHNKGLQFIGKPTQLKKQTGQESLERAFLHLIDDKEESKAA